MFLSFVTMKKADMSGDRWKHEDGVMFSYIYSRLFC